MCPQRAEGREVGAHNGVTLNGFVLRAQEVLGQEGGYRTKVPLRGRAAPSLGHTSGTTTAVSLSGDRRGLLCF